MHVATRRRQGVPTQPKSFILRFDELFERDLGFVLIVRDGEQTIAAAVFLSFNGTLIYKYGASDPAALGKRPNNLLFLEAIRGGCAAGMHTLDLGRTDVDHKSLREFKTSWGAHERVLEYHELGAARAPRHREQRRHGPPHRSHHPPQPADRWSDDRRGTVPLRGLIRISRPGRSRGARRARSRARKPPGQPPAAGSESRAIARAPRRR